MMETLVPLLFAYLTVLAFANICPFPGIPKNGYGTDGHSKYLNWSVRQDFSENDVVKYKCEEGWATSWTKEAIRCQSDGTWNATVPKCGK
jgi:Sushi repeat (SCR repeat)